MAISVDEAFPDPYAPYCDEDGTEYEYDDSECYLYQCYDGDVGEAWNWEDAQKYPGRNTDEFMEELTEPWR